MSSTLIWQSLGRSTRTAPCLPVKAMWNADLMAGGISEGLLTWMLYLVAEAVIPMMSTSWKASVPTTLRGTWPVKATTGAESMFAVAIPVTRFVAPGPEVARHTPTFPRALA